MRNKATLVASVLAALGATACCAGPLVLLFLAIGGGWASHLIALEPYSPYLTALTALCLGIVFNNLYVRRRTCTRTEACSDDHVLRNQRILFWLVSLPVILLLTFPLYASLFY